MRRAVPYLIVSLAVLLFFVDVATGAATFFFRDLTVFGLPFHHLVAQALRGGELPLWNPALHLGMPLAADASAMPWYLPGWLLTPLDDERAISWFVLGHLTWAGCGAVRLARVHGASAPAAVLAGVSYGLGGYLLGVHWNLIYLASAAWLPWLLATAATLLQAPSARRALLLALCWSALVYAGDAQLALMAGPLLLLTLLLVPRQQLARRAPWLVVSGALALGLAALQWLPGLQLARGSLRAGGLGRDEVLAWSLAPSRLLDLVLPPDAGARLVDESVLAWTVSLYPGLVAGGLALVALLWPRTRAARFALVSALVFGLLALGQHTPLYRGLLSLLPVLQVFRYPSKLVVVSTLAWSLGAALGLDAVLTSQQHRARGLLVALAGLAALGAALPGVWPNPTLPLHAAGVALLLAATVVGVQRGWLRAAPASALLVAVALVDLALAQQPLRLVGDPSLLRETPASVARILELDSAQGAPRIHMTPELMQAARHLRTLREQGSGAWFVRTALESARLMPNGGVTRGLAYLHGFSPLEPRSRVVWRSVEQQQRLLDLCSVAVVAAPHTLEALPGDVVLLDRPDLNLRLFHNADRWPRAYVLEAKDAAPLLAASHMAVDLPPLQPQAGARAQLVREHMNSLELRVTAPRPGWLILSDRLDPDWRARVDGVPVPIRPALGLLRAVPVAAGSQRVVFDYRPRAVLWGAVVSTLTLLGCLIAIGRAVTAASPSGPGRRPLSCRPRAWSLRDPAPVECDGSAPYPGDRGPP